MSQAELVDELAGPDGAIAVAVARLPSGSAFRTDGLCPEQVERLVALGGAWPPIVVGRRDAVVVDGAHRVEAARRLGFVTIPAILFDGGPEDAFVEFVRRNVAHGLVLSLGERKRAAVRVLQGHPGWSDRRVAELCALSPKTVGRIRSNVGYPRQQALREGRDGRLRPAQRGSVRARVAEALRARPDASLRTIAAEVSVSPETVRLVRLNLASEPEPAAVVDHGPDPEPEHPSWRADAALLDRDDGDDFLSWFERTAVSGSDLDRAEAVPLSRVYLLAEEARRRSETWLDLARALEARPARAR